VGSALVLHSLEKADGGAVGEQGCGEGLARRFGEMVR
jgi:hypothetical protein